VVAGTVNLIPGVRVGVGEENQKNSTGIGRNHNEEALESIKSYSVCYNKHDPSISSLSRLYNRGECSFGLPIGFLHLHTWAALMASSGGPVQHRVFGIRPTHSCTAPWGLASIRYVDTPRHGSPP
jgi:hypothetical protein